MLNHKSVFELFENMHKVYALTLKKIYFYSLCECVCVCVRVREWEREYVRVHLWKTIIHIFSRINNCDSQVFNVRVVNKQIWGTLFFFCGCRHITTSGQYHQHFMNSFYAHRYQKRKKTLMTWLSFCAFGICEHKGCS